MRCSNPKCDQELDPGWQVCPVCLTKVSAENAHTDSRIRLIILGEGPLDGEFNVEEYFRVPGHEDGIPYTAISHKMFYGRRSVPDYWGLVLYYNDGRKFLTDPKGFFTLEKLPGLQGIYWLPKENLAKLEREPISNSRISKSPAPDLLFDCVDGRRLRDSDLYFRCSECEGICREENRVKHPDSLVLPLCRNCGDAAVASLWEQRRKEEERRRKAEEERRRKEEEERRCQEEERCRRASFSSSYSKSEIENIIKDKIMLHLNVLRGEIRSDSRLIEDLGADSLDLVDLVIDIEEEFELDFTDADQSNIRNVGDIVSGIYKKTNI